MGRWILFADWWMDFRFILFLIRRLLTSAETVYAKLECQVGLPVKITQQTRTTTFTSTLRSQYTNPQLHPCSLNTNSLTYWILDCRSRDVVGAIGIVCIWMEGIGIKVWMFIECLQVTWFFTINPSWLIYYRFQLSYMLNLCCAVCPTSKNDK